MTCYIEQIRPTVIVKIDQLGPPLHISGDDAETRGYGHIGEIALSIISIECRHFVGKQGLNNVHSAVAVIIGDSQSHTRLFAAILTVSEASVSCKVGEGSVFVVTIK